MSNLWILMLAIGAIMLIAYTILAVFSTINDLEEGSTIFDLFDDFAFDHTTLVVLWGLIIGGMFIVSLVMWIFERT